MDKTKKKDRPDFAKNIILRRKALDLNAMELAEKARIPYPTLRDIELGYSHGREETKEAIAKALGCSISDLYMEPRDSLKAMMATQSQSDSNLLEAAQVLEALGRLAPVRRAIALALIFQDGKHVRTLPPTIRQVVLSILKTS